MLRRWYVADGPVETQSITRKGDANDVEKDASDRRIILLRGVVSAIAAKPCVPEAQEIVFSHPLPTFRKQGVVTKAPLVT